MPPSILCRCVQALLLGVAVSFVSQPAGAATKTWTGGTFGLGGSWNDPTDWSPTGVPANGDTVDAFGAGGGFSTFITYDYPGPPITLAALVVNHSNATILSLSTTLTIPGGSLSTAFESIGDTRLGGSRGRGVVTQTGGGHFIVGTSVFGMGYNPTDLGSYNLSGTGSLVLSNVSAWQVGVGGTGFLNISGGAALNSLIPLTFGVNAGAHGNATLTSGFLQSSSLTLGLSGTGVMAQSGGFVSAVGNLYLGYNAGSSGSYTLDDTGNLHVTNNEIIGFNGTGTFIQSGGTHTASTLFVDHGSYTLSNGTLAPGNLVISGPFTQSGGFNQPTSATISAAATYTLTGGALLFQDTGNALGSTFSIGFAGPGTFAQSGGIVNATSLVIHDLAGASAYDALYTLSDGTASFQNISIGHTNGGTPDAGTALLSQTGGSLYTVQLNFADQSSATCIYNLSGGSLTADSIFLSQSLGQHGTFNVSGTARAFIGSFFVNDTFNQSGGTVTVASQLGSFGNMNLTAGTFLVSGSLQMADNTNTFFGSINLSNASFIVQPSSPSDKSAKIALLGAAIASGRNGGLWNGKGITSPVAAADPIHYTVGLFDNASLAKATYGGLPVDANSLFIATARFGDANLDGKVDALDLNILAAHWQQTSPGLFSDGDFTNDGKVDALDLNLLAANWQFGSAALLADLADLPYARASSPTPVPEPASQILCVIPALLLVRRRLPNRPA